MASFDPEEQRSEESLRGENAVTKYSIKRLELSIQKFVKVLDIDLDRLFKHRVNILRLTSAEDWNGLHREQINACRTVQQIKANIKEIDKARNQVNDEDLAVFDSKVEDVKEKAVVAMQEFLIFIGIDSTTPGGHDPIPDVSTERNTELAVSNGDSPLYCETNFGKGSEISAYPADKVSNISGNVNSQCHCTAYDSTDNDLPSSTPYGSLPAILTVMPIPSVITNLHVVPQNSEASASWEELQENIVELNELVHEFAVEIQQQGEKIDAIDDNIEVASQNVRAGTTQLARAAKYKSALLPVVGAVIGGVVAGPFGLLAGAKIGAAAGAVGGAVGFAGGRYVKKRQNKITEMEMSNLKDRRSISLPDLQTCEDTSTSSVPVYVNQTSTQTPTTTQNNAGFSNNISETFTTVTSSFKRLFSSSEGKE